MLMMQFETSLNSMISAQIILSKCVSQISPKVVVSCRILINRGKEFSMNMVNMFIYSLLSFFLDRAAARVFFTRTLRSFAAGMMTRGSFLAISAGLMTLGSFLATSAGMMTLGSFLATSAGLMTGGSLLGTLS